MDDRHDRRSEEEGPGLGKRLEGILPEFFKRTLLSGVGALFMTEEGLRGLASDLKLPKDVAAYVLSQTDRTRRELFGLIAREIRGAVETVNVAGELQRVLTGLTFEVKAQVRFIPNDEGMAVRPRIKATVKGSDDPPPAPRRRRGARKKREPPQA